MKLVFTLLFISSTLIYSFSLNAREVADVDIAETISFTDQSTKLSLNGAGIRTKFVFDIYIGSLYLEKKQNTPNGVYNSDGEKRVSMHFLHSEVSKEKLINGWNDGFESNHSSKELEKIKSRIIQFNNLFETVKKGDVINLNFIPTTGTEVIINNQSKGTIEGDDFFVAVLKIWLGEEPADEDLKYAMLAIQPE